MAKKDKKNKQKEAASDNGRTEASVMGHPILSGPVSREERRYPYEDRMKKKLYEKTLLDLQVELLKVQNWVETEHTKIVVLFEGRDAAGKGGTIKRFQEHLNPRGARAVALPKPSDVERGQWYFQRYIAELPTEGEIVFFDRSWYNRAGVEPVMGFCTPDQYQRFIHQVSGLENALIDSGCYLFKLWFDVGRKEQLRRIEARRDDPLKRWKLSPMDLKSLERWDDYTRARDAMFLYSDTKHAPWTVILSDDKRRARINAMLAVLNVLPYPDKDDKVVQSPDPKIVGSVDHMFPLAGRYMFAGSDA